MRDFTFNSERISDQLISWWGEHIWTTDMLYQAIILVCATIVGRLIYRLVRGHVSEAVDASRMPIRAKRTIRHLQRLIFPLVTLIVAFFATRIAGSDFIGFNVGFNDTVMKLILAWIGIRIALEFVEYSIMRNFFALSIWTIAALSIFNVLPQTFALLDAIGFNIGEFRLSALVVVKGTFSLVILLYFAMFVSTFAERQVLRAKSLNRSSQVLVAKIIRIVLIVFALLIGVTSAGIDLSIFAVLSGAIGLGIGFGLQKVVSNLFSGMLLLLDRSITPGDVIELENSGTFGWVSHMGARYTEIITRDHKSYLIPNEDFITQRVVNWSHGNDRLVRVHIEFGVHYDSDPHKVIEIAIAAAQKPERVVDEPKPVCWIMGFGDSSVDFTLRFWIKDAEGGVANIQGQVFLSLWDALKENKISIPYPHREVYIHQT